MPFIGNKPTAIPLSADDLEDNIISTAKIQDNAVTAAKYIEPIPFRNIIINGDMSIAQRSTSVASITDDGYYTVDRFKTLLDTLGTWTQSQSTDVPTGQGFATSLKMDCTTADASPASADRMFLYQRFEGQMLQYLKKGTASAQSLTLSFWVKSNKTGTYICELGDNDNSRKFSKSYTVDVTNTWEKKTLTFAGDTTGTLDNDNNNSLDVIWWLGAGTDYSSGTLNNSWNGSVANANRAVGQVNLADDTANEWYITGVQLEAGTTASDFEFLPHDVNLARCQRYCYVLDNGSTSGYYCMGFAQSSSEANIILPLYVAPRSRPTGVTVTNASSFGATTQQAGRVATSITFSQGTLQAVHLAMASSSGTNYTVGLPIFFYNADTGTPGKIILTGMEL
jgi:hypothetical protein